MPNGSDIIVRAGSAEVEFDPDIFRPESNQPGRKKFKNDNRKITRIEITGGGMAFNTGDHPQGLDCVITVHTT
ncbi:MAG TPA: hypothetical protein VFH31_14010 [Pyrinomonadaceae bacterium]|nr:hypothetical protein [Pyrinomonadaceae bacterium]